MASADGLKILKNWQNSRTVIVLTSVSLKGSGSIFDVHVMVLSVDASTLTLASMESPGETERIDLRGAAFASPDMPTPALEVTCADGKKTLLREE